MKIAPEIWRVALIIALGAMISQVDTSVVNVGLDRIRRDLDAGLADAQWVANAYLIALAAALPACGWLTRRAGAGRVWLWSLAGFTIASGLCAIAPSLGWLVAFRVLQGLFAGLLLPAGQTVLGQAVGPDRLGRVMATLGIAVTLGPTLGLVLGGVIVEVGSWPWLFALNLPIGAVAVALGVRYVPRGDTGTAGPLDWRGLALVSTGVPLVIYGATAWAEHRTLTATAVAAPLLAGAAALAAFARHCSARSRGDRRAAILDLGLFRRPAYRAACAVTATVGAAMFGAGQLLPLYYQLGRDESVLATGLLLVSMSFGTAVVLPFSGRLVDRFGSGPVATAGATATALTTLPFAFVALGAADVALQLLLLVRGMALALLAVPATTGAYTALTRAQLPDATAQVNIVLRVGGALGGALFAVILATNLPAGTEAAFHTAFGWLAAASLLGVAASVWLLVAERERAGGCVENEHSRVVRS